MGGYFPEKKRKVSQRKFRCSPQVCLRSSSPWLPPPFQSLSKGRIISKRLEWWLLHSPSKPGRTTEKSLGDPSEKVTMRTSGYHRAVDTSYWSVIFLCSSYGDIAWWCQSKKGAIWQQLLLPRCWGRTLSASAEIRLQPIWQGRYTFNRMCIYI